MVRRGGDSVCLLMQIILGWTGGGVRLELPLSPLFSLSLYCNSFVMEVIMSLIKIGTILPYCNCGQFMIQFCDILISFLFMYMF